MGRSERRVFVSATDLSFFHRAIILEKVCQYLYFKVRYANTTAEIPEFKVEPEIALELLMAADFLDSKLCALDI